ncbi:DUF4091 domain-containing protein [Candidatus Bathyarchaeota archaeon]|nr:DUF4091 domain-containing protein [Candidatus Bathyarchaeota archaeon]
MGSFNVWVQDSLTKVFKDSAKPEDAVREVAINAARNEYEAVQIVVRPFEDIDTFRVCATGLRHESNDYMIAKIYLRFVGYVPVKRNTPDSPPEELVRKAPDLFPDPLLEEETVKLRKDENQPIWLTVYIPKDAPAGNYYGELLLEGFGEEAVKIYLKVHDVTLPSKRALKLSNFLSPYNISRFHNARLWSEEYWAILKAYAQNMAEHRQSSIITPILELTRIYRGNGRLEFDFQLLDRWINLFREAGVIGIIEGGYLAGRPPRTVEGWWTVQEFLSASYRVLNKDGGLAYVQEPVKVSSPIFEEFISQFMPALQNHLEDIGLLDNYLQHIADEPIDRNAESYKLIVNLVRKYAPKIRIIEASTCKQLVDYINVLVPLLDDYDRNMNFYEERKKKGNGVWFYICLAPTGRYPNRFIDYSLVKVRILHWINFKYGLEGYLHWGYNYWTEKPFEDVENEPHHPFSLPPGDAFIVYPGKSGPLDSIRFEALRDGVEDYEMLKMLVEEKGLDEAIGLCSTAVKNITEYVRTSREFLSIRLKLISELESIG